MEEFEERLLKPKEAARLFGITVKTLWVWQRKGIIRAIRLLTGKFRFRESDVRRLLREMYERSK